MIKIFCDVCGAEITDERRAVDDQAYETEQFKTLIDVYEVRDVCNRCISACVNLKLDGILLKDWRLACGITYKREDAN